MLSLPRLGDYGYLGNAMFQYSALLGIADKTKLNPVYDFKKKGTMCTLHDVFPLSKVEDVEHHIQVHSVKKIIKEPFFHFSEDMFSVEDNVGLNGYFQSEKYFKHIEDVIRSEFKFSDDVENSCIENLKGAKEQSKSESIVGVHIRLGDYQKLEHIYVPLLKTGYYNNAINFINTNVKGDKTYLVFSDNIEMCQQIFKGSDNFIFASGGSPEQDMCMMSKCDHNIIANSSFSWWGGWLNKNKDKKVIAPINWFVPNEKDVKDTKDLYCEDWIKV